MGNVLAKIETVFQHFENKIDKENIHAILNFLDGAVIHNTVKDKVDDGNVVGAV